MTKRQEIIVRKALQKIACYYGEYHKVSAPLQQLAKDALEAFPDKLNLCESCSLYPCGNNSPIGLTGVCTTLCACHKLKEPK